MRLNKKYKKKQNIGVIKSDKIMDNSTSITTKENESYNNLSTLNIFLMFIFALSGACLVYLFLKCIVKKK
jgi:hypothetical protein